MQYYKIQLQSIDHEHMHVWVVVAGKNAAEAVLKAHRHCENLEIFRALEESIFEITESEYSHHFNKLNKHS